MQLYDEQPFEVVDGEIETRHPSRPLSCPAVTRTANRDSGLP
jgi:hypothetical protein